MKRPRIHRLDGAVLLAAALLSPLLPCPSRAASELVALTQIQPGGSGHIPRLSPDGNVIAYYLTDGILRWAYPDTTADLGGLPTYGVTGIDIGGHTILANTVYTFGATASFWPKRWTAATGWVDLPLPGSPNQNLWLGYALSKDGLVVGGVGGPPMPAQSGVFRWNATEGLEQLPLPPGYTSSTFGGMNSVGNVIVGSVTSSFPNTDPQGFIWADGSVRTLPGVTPTATSTQIVAGTTPSGAPFIYDRATESFDGTATAGIEQWPSGTTFTPDFVSWSGAVVFGHIYPITGYSGYAWKQGSGLMTLAAFLGQLGGSAAGWSDLRVLDASAGGRILLGIGTREGIRTFWYFAADADDDGLLDEWETPGSGYMLHDGTRYTLAGGLGCSPNRKDILVEIDAMSGRGPASFNTGSEMDRVVQAFANAPVPSADGSLPGGIQLHLIPSEYDLPHLPLTNADAWSQFGTLKAAHFGGPNTITEASIVYEDELESLWRKIAHYCVFADSLSDRRSASIGELHGNDAMIMLGYSIVSPARRPKYEAGMLMYVLGEMLGLDPGGHQGAMGPNYRSAMNPIFTLPQFSIQDEQKSFWEPRFSDEEMPALDSYALSETAGILSPQGRSANKGFPYSIPMGAVSATGSGAPCSDRDTNIEDCMDWGFYGKQVDWDADREIDENPVQVPINAIVPPHQPFSPMLGRNDWPLLKYNFRTSSYYAQGVHPAEIRSAPFRGPGLDDLIGGSHPFTFDDQVTLDQMSAAPVCPEVTHPSPSGLICSNESVTLNAGVTGTYLKYQWYSIPDPWHSYPWTPIEGATDSVLAMSPLSPDIYWRRCIVSNACDRDTLEWSVTVNSGPPQILAQPQSQTVNVGDEVSISALVSEGYFPVWRRDGVVVGEVGIDAYFPSVTKDDAGVYQATIINGCDSVMTEPMNLVVLDPASVGAGPLHDFYLRTRNPLRGETTVSFALPSSAPATLALYDVSGRKIVTREVGSMGAGSHSVVLGGGVRLEPGYYVVRLRQGERSLSRSLLVIR